MHTQPKEPGIGVGIMIFKEGKLLLGQRIKPGSLSHGTYQFPGGRLDPGETPREGAKREVAEECGITTTEPELVCVNFIKQHPTRVNIIWKADWISGEPKRCEPDKCAGWQWYSLETLPEPILWPNRLGIEAYHSGARYLEE